VLLVLQILQMLLKNSTVFVEFYTEIINMVVFELTTE